MAQLTHLRISVPASGAPPGQVPADCYPEGVPPKNRPSSRSVSFAVFRRQCVRRSMGRRRNSYLWSLRLTSSRLWGRR